MRGGIFHTRTHHLELEFRETAVYGCLGPSRVEDSLEALSMYADRGETEHLRIALMAFGNYHIEEILLVGCGLDSGVACIDDATQGIGSVTNWEVVVVCSTGARGGAYWHLGHVWLPLPTAYSVDWACRSGCGSFVNCAAEVVLVMVVGCSSGDALRRGAGRVWTCIGGVDGDTARVVGADILRRACFC